MGTPSPKQCIDKCNIYNTVSTFKDERGPRGGNMSKASKGRYREWVGMGWEWGATWEWKMVSYLYTMRGVHEMAKVAGEQMVLGVGEQVEWGAAAAVRCPRCWLWLLHVHMFLCCWQHFVHLVLLLGQS